MMEFAVAARWARKEDLHYGAFLQRALKMKIDEKKKYLYTKNNKMSKKKVSFFSKREPSHGVRLPAV